MHRAREPRGRACRADFALHQLAGSKRGIGHLPPGSICFGSVPTGPGPVTYDITGVIGNSVPYTLSLALSPADEGPGPNPIPLPPAARSALATMAAFGAAKARRRLFAPARRSS